MNTSLYDLDEALVEQQGNYDALVAELAAAEAALAVAKSDLANIAKYTEDIAHKYSLAEAALSAMTFDHDQAQKNLSDYRALLDESRNRLAAMTAERDRIHGQFITIENESNSLHQQLVTATTQNGVLAFRLDAARAQAERLAEAARPFTKFHTQGDGQFARIANGQWPTVAEVEALRAALAEMEQK